ncbi:hypothetical protein [Clostridium cellulovorans]|nr:hypothetical protein [Clostridium cellulovorans]
MILTVGINLVDGKSIIEGTNYKLASLGIIISVSFEEDTINS